MSEFLTPKDVHDKEFTTHRLREGYDMAEVDSFLRQVETTVSVLGVGVPIQHQTQSDARLAWLDIETTGLDPENDDILEIGLICTSFDPWDERSFFARWVIRPDCWESVREGMSKRALEMHSQNGLLAQIDAKEATVSEETALRELGQWLDCMALQHETHLAGSSVHFDRRFIEARDPEIFSTLSHRMVDVSALDVMARNINPSLAMTAPPTMHRVDKCIDNSRLLFDHYRRLFTPRPTTKSLKKAKSK